MLILKEYYFSASLSCLALVDHQKISAYRTIPDVPLWMVWAVVHATSQSLLLSFVIEYFSL